MNSSINTVTGTISPEQLGRTLMHEHVFVEYGGPSAEVLKPGRRHDEIVSVCTDYLEQLRAFGVETLVDPTTVDLGRNASLLAELAGKTGFNIICATGIYSTSTYVRMRERLGNSPEAIAELFIKELTEGIADTGVKAGIIKVVTGAPMIDEEEHELLLAAAKASVATGAAIITHTEGILGDEQQRILTSAGVPAQRIVIGHSCLSRNFDYHMSIMQGGSYLAFDRFGMTGMPDEVRAASMQKLIDAGWAAQLMVSHDSVWYWVGGPKIGSGAYKNWVPTNFFERVIPMLQYGGTTDDQIETMLRENPRRFFSGEKPSPVT
jgi:phosphotriesterase-related protein